MPEIDITCAPASLARQGKLGDAIVELIKTARAGNDPISTDEVLRTLAGNIATVLVMEIAAADRPRHAATVTTMIDGFLAKWRREKETH
ncbi:MAG: hypothetical protein RIM84_06290 [Alphaproteobacteria bacterium]